MNPQVTWNAIMLNPRLSIRWVVEKKPNLFYLLLVIFMFGVLREATKIKTGDQDPVDLAVTLVLFGGIMQLVVFNILIWCVNAMAKWLGGSGNFSDTQVGFTWSLCFFMALEFILAGFSFALTGEAYQQIQDINKNDFRLVFYWIYMILNVGQIAWYVVLMIATISEVHTLPVKRSILSLVLGFLISIGPLMVISIIVQPDQWLAFLY